MAPWTIPGNRAIGYAAKESYVIIEVTALGEESSAKVGEHLVVAKLLLEQVLKDCRIAGHKILAEMKGGELAGTIAAHPFRGQGYDFDVPLYAGDFVTMDQGTGFVHIAPGHGSDDYDLGYAKGLEIPLTVDGDGRFMEHVPLFAGRVEPYGGG